ncbi:acetylornithine deacetylase [Tianweitania sediminis]|uniref:Acetylornithine deacetylase n=1 Tax=Tianweitania sediminis TaxID=1502156 RepID=A0A8J7RGY6_9HYPH|nr:acetylornithine deacetylase [Tianweitania sediminis]MBP0437061.1 acetylornithine deacetylase [Tianweitania sediminis]
MRNNDSIAIISDLVGFQTVSRNSNSDLLAYVADYLSEHGVTSDILWNDDRSKGNLWATIGPADVPGVILSGHSDVVPVDGQDWTSDPFVARITDSRIFGRGTCDMKGFIGIVLAAVPDLVTRDLKAPIHIAISYDEEVGCTGVSSLIDRLAALPVKPALCIVGEPTSMQVIVGHKGIGLYRVTVTGSAAHSSQAPYAVNAIEYAAQTIVFIKSLSTEQAHAGPHDHDYDVSHSTISVTTIEGGAAVNIIPERCVFQFDIRSLPQLETEAVLARIQAFLDAEIRPAMRATSPASGVQIEPLVEIVGLDTEVTHPAVTFLKTLVGRNDHAKVAYCTEAGLFSTQAGIVSLVCGPGSMEQGHKPDEFLALSQIERCEEMISRLADRLEDDGLPWSAELRR